MPAPAVAIPATSLAALPPLFAAAAVLVVGLWMLRSGRRSTIGLQFFLATLSLDLWLWSIAALLITRNHDRALLCARLGYLGLPFIPAALFHAIVATPTVPRRTLRVIGGLLWAVAAGFSVAAMLDGRFVTGVDPFALGYRPNYGPFADWFLLFFVCVVLASVVQLVVEWNQGASESAGRRRHASLLMVFAIGCLASVDFLPRFGIGIYPVGYFGIVLCLAVVGYVIWRDRPAPITPALAAPEILETMSDALLVLDPNGIIRLANPAAVAWFGRLGPALVGRPIRDVLDGAPLGEALAGLPEGERLEQQDFSHVRAPDDLRIVNVATTVMRHHDGTPLGTVCVLRDVTESRRLEQQMQQSQKLEAIGQLAGGIAHDLNNILQVVIANVDMLRLEQPQHEAALSAVRDAARRGAWLTRRLLEFARRQILEPVVLDLATTVQDMQTMLQRLVGEHIQIALMVHQGELLVRADRGQIEQILLNLVVNSRDAMPRGGRITIEVRDDATRKLATLRVTDTGSGMDDSTRARIFEPFFTTKGIQGTGLGLSTVYGIVKQNAGQIEVETAPGAGASFTISLPRARGRISNPKDQKPEGARGRETILLVEDDPAVRASTRRALERAGYRVIEAEHGNDALERSAAHEGGIDLMLTDVSMPGIPVTEMVRQLGAARPEMELLFMSGYSNDAVVRHGIEQTGAGFLQKPFEMGDLLAKVRFALDRGRQPAES